jgi:hypothetical protein
MRLRKSRETLCDFVANYYSVSQKKREILLKQQSNPATKIVLCDTLD